MQKSLIHPRPDRERVGVRVDNNPFPSPFSSPPRGEGAKIEILDLGTVPYAESLEIQHRLVDERARGLRSDTLILLEHPHVITRGRGYNGYTLGETRHPIFDIERGGDITYHGPGQLVGYPIIHLKERGLLIGQYLRLIETILIEAVGNLGISTQRLKGFTGVWTDAGKLASIGVAVKSWVSYHGFALNVSTDLSQFSGIHPCGLEPEQMTSMERILGRKPDLNHVREEISLAFHRHLN